MSGQTLRAAPLDQSEPVERAGLDELRALQLIRLTQALSRAALVPQYRQKFAEAGIAPGDLKHLDDLKAFPFTTRGIWRQNFPLECSPCRCTRSCASMPRAARPESPRWSAIRAATLNR